MLTRREIEVLLAAVERWQGPLDRGDTNVVYDALPPFDHLGVVAICDRYNDDHAAWPGIRDALAPEIALAWERALAAGEALTPDFISEVQHEVASLPRPFFIMLQFQCAALIEWLRGERDAAAEAQS